MCLALGNNQHLNIIIHECLFTGDVRGFVRLFVCFGLLFCCFYKPYLIQRLGP